MKFTYVVPDVAAEVAVSVAAVELALVEAAAEEAAPGKQEVSLPALTVI